jgi:hypothetical protein
MANATWKDHERRTARALGGVRLTPTGKAQPDVVTDWLTIECKHRAELPAWLLNAVNQARRFADAQRLGIVVLHGKGRRDSLVVLSLADFREWFGELGSVADVPGE